MNRGPYWPIGLSEKTQTYGRLGAAMSQLEEALVEFHRSGTLGNFFNMMKCKVEFERVFNGWCCVYHREMLSKFGQEYPDGCPSCE